MKNFYRNFLKLCSMLVLQNVVTLSVNLADNIMLGAFSETALSGVTTVNQVQFVFQQLLMALGDGLVIFGSQYWGKKETKPVRKISGAVKKRIVPNRKKDQGFIINPKVLLSVIINL